MRELLDGARPRAARSRPSRSIVARAEGIPLYAVETIRMLVADGRLRERADGVGYEPAGRAGRARRPGHAPCADRRAPRRLDPADRALLQDAAVLGQSFTLGRAGGGRRARRPDARRRRTRAPRPGRAAAQSSSTPRSPERGQYAFVQALIREVAYSTLALRDRRSRHLAAARYFESIGDDELAGALAAHYLAAYRASTDGPEAEALVAQARISLRAAADRAIALGAPGQAVTFLEHAIEVTDIDADKADLHERAGNAAVDGGDDGGRPRPVRGRAPAVHAARRAVERGAADRPRIAGARQAASQRGGLGAARRLVGRDRRPRRRGPGAHGPRPPDRVARAHPRGLRPRDPTGGSRPRRGRARGERRDGGRQPDDARDRRVLPGPAVAGPRPARGRAQDRRGGGPVREPVPGPGDAAVGVGPRRPARRAGRRARRDRARPAGGQPDGEINILFNAVEDARRTGDWDWAAGELRATGAARDRRVEPHRQPDPEVFFEIFRGTLDEAGIEDLRRADRHARRQATSGRDSSTSRPPSPTPPADGPTRRPRG